jgi:hypothetical protein
LDTGLEEAAIAGERYGLIGDPGVAVESVIDAAV